MSASEKDDPFDEATRFDPTESARIAQSERASQRVVPAHQVRTTIDLVAPNHPRHSTDDFQRETKPIASIPSADDPTSLMAQPDRPPPPKPRQHDRPVTADSLNQEWAPLYLDDEVLGSRSVNLKLNAADLEALHTPAPPDDLDAAATGHLPSMQKPAPIRVKRSSVAAPQVKLPPSGRPGHPGRAPTRAASKPPFPARPAPAKPAAAKMIPGKAADPKLIEGSRIGNYEVIRKIGQGGMGVVYEGRHLLLPRRVAIKFLITDQSHDEEQIRRFLGEAVASAQIGHKGVVDIYDYGYNEDKTAYLIMEFVDGQSLQAVMKRSGQLPVPMVIRVVRDIAEVLAAAHQSGIVHRDLKPDNIVLSRDEHGKDFVKILDFGVAKFVNDQGLSGQTIAGSILGTPWYMPPEQCQGLRDVDYRSDIYALGCVFYQMLAGKVPFAGSLRDVLTSHIHAAPTPPSQFNPSVPRAVETLILRMMAKQPGDRPHSMEEVAHVLAELGGPGIQPAVKRSSPGMPPGAAALAPAKKGSHWLLPVLAAIIACAGTAAAFYFLRGG